MAKLIDLFNEREPELYNYVKYPYKEDDDTQPYRYTTLDNAEPMNNTFFEDQSNPVSLSARRDFNRMFQFSKSAQGLVFLGKQTFLQTGNTFAQTRLYNPLNVQIHSVPFVHMSRHVDVKQTIQSILGHKIISFAYPNGNFNEDISNLVKATGYHIAFTTMPGKVVNSDDAYSIKRINIHDDITRNIPMFYCHILGIF